MLSRVIVGLAVIVAIIEGVTPEGTVPEAILPLILVILGLVYGVMCLESDNRVGFSVLALAVGAAASTDVLSNIHVIGGYLDAIVDQISVALYAGVVAVLVMGIWEVIMPSSDEG